MRHVLVVCEGRIATVELVGVYPLELLCKRGGYEYRYLNSPYVSPADVAWCDVLFLIRGSTGHSLRCFDRARQQGKKTVVYWDDNVFALPSHSHSFTHFAQPETVARLHHTLRYADVVGCTTKRLGALLTTKTSAPVVTLAVPAMDMVKAPKQPGERRLVGYAGSIDHQDVVRHLLFPAWERLASADSKLDFELIGPRLPVPSTLSGRVKCSQYTSTYDEWLRRRRTLGWDLATVPLVDSSFSACKYHNKLVELGATGVPCVFSQVPPYTDAVVDDVTGFLVSNDANAWFERTLGVLRDDTRRLTVAGNVLSKLAAENSDDAVATSYTTLFDTLLADYERPVVVDVELGDELCPEFSSHGNVTLNAVGGGCSVERTVLIPRDVHVKEVALMGATYRNVMSRPMYYELYHNGARVVKGNVHSYMLTDNAWWPLPVSVKCKSGDVLRLVATNCNPRPVTFYANEGTTDPALRLR